jgi:hypothetical protein
MSAARVCLVLAACLTIGLRLHVRVCPFLGRLPHGGRRKFPYLFAEKK